MARFPEPRSRRPARDCSLCAMVASMVLSASAADDAPEASARSWRRRSAPVASAADVALELPLGRLGVNLADAPNGEVLVEDLGEALPEAFASVPGIK